MSLIFFSLVVIVFCSIIISYSTADYCLAEPPELIWDSDPNDIFVHEGMLQFTAQSFFAANGDGPTDFTTRVFNNIFPGPTLRMQRGHEYYVTLQNTLGPNNINEPKIMNTYNSPNTTNLHVHGLHISPQSPGDNVFDNVEPGETRLYEYIIPCNHAGGTHWYHSHHHMSTALSVGGGAVGMLIIEDDAIAEGLPTWLTQMNEYILMIHYVDLGFLDNLFNNDYDQLFRYTTNNGPFYLLNGKYQPQICLNAGQWTRLRIGYVRANGADDTFMIIDDQGKNNTCTLKLISRDGILVHGTNNVVPRNINLFWLTTSSRLDVAVHCPGNISGKRNYTLVSYQPAPTGGSPGPPGGRPSRNSPAPILTKIATIQVTGTALIPDVTLTTFNPIRPSYLPNLLTSTVSSTWDIGISGTGLSSSLTGPTSFQGEFNYLKNLTIGEVYEWHLCAVNVAHPFHMHINHFQIYRNGAMPNHVGTDVNAVGDYIDTLYVSSTCPDTSRGGIRFKPDVFGGIATLHCHNLQHEDNGAMATVFINGGCNYDLTQNATSYDPTAPSCAQVSPTC